MTTHPRLRVVRIMRKDGHRVTKRIHRVTNDELRHFKHLGTAWGSNFNHCLQLAENRIRNFSGRVDGFTLDLTKRYGVTAYFYQRKRR